MKIVLIILAFIPTLTFAETIYKCPDPNGIMKFQQQPCAGGKELGITTNPQAQREKAEFDALVQKKIREDYKPTASNLYQDFLLKQCLDDINKHEYHKACDEYRQYLKIIREQIYHLYE